MATKKDEKVSEEIAAVIGMALYHLSEEAHDVENTVLTFGDANRSCSPWSSKIFALRQLPNRR